MQVFLSTTTTVPKGPTYQPEGRTLDPDPLPLQPRVTPTPPSRMPEDEALDSVSEEEPTVEVEEEVWEYVKPSEEAKMYVCNLPYNVSSECLAQLLGQAGVVQVSKVSNSSSLTILTAGC
ncbi:nucleic acid binding protein 1 [Hordeum vulgare]|nr:nucleic acid binding protein 1 [Hordeum vulgare]